MERLRFIFFLPLLFLIGCTSGSYSPEVQENSTNPDGTPAYVAPKPVVRQSSGLTHADYTALCPSTILDQKCIEFGRECLAEGHKVNDLRLAGCITGKVESWQNEMLASERNPAQFYGMCDVYHITNKDCRAHTFLCVDDGHDGRALKLCMGRRLDQFDEAWKKIARSSG